MKAGSAGGTHGSVDKLVGWVVIATPSILRSRLSNALRHFDRSNAQGEISNERLNMVSLSGLVRFLPLVEMTCLVEMMFPSAPS